MISTSRVFFFVGEILVPKFPFVGLHLTGTKTENPEELYLTRGDASKKNIKRIKKNIGRG